MEKETYLEKLKQLEKDFSDGKNKLYREYALSNAKFKIGDMIRDSTWTLVVDKITVYVGFNLPEAVYHGFELKKDLTPRKDKNRVSIYGNKAELIRNA